MAEMDFEKLLQGEGLSADAVDEGEYLFRVIDSRSHEGKGNGTVFLDLEVQEGPLEGKIAQVSIFIPDGSGANPRGASFHFAKKVAGFQLPAEVGRAMNGGNPAPILAEALMDQVFYGEVSIQSDGAYAGSNNLVVTKPADQPVASEAPAKKAAAPSSQPEAKEEPESAAASEEELPF